MHPYDSYRRGLHLLLFQAELNRREEYNAKMADANEKQEREKKELEESKVAEKDNKVVGTEKTNLPSDEN